MGNVNDCFSCFDYPNLIIAVKTGDTKGVGLHNCAYITLIDDKGKSTQEFCLLGNCFTVFKRGHTDVFTFRANLEGIGPIVKLKLVRSELNEKRCVDWFVEKIELRHYFGTVDNLTGKEDIVFPFNRWVRNRRPIIIEKFDCSLPQSDTEGEQRELELFWKRKMYNYHRRFESLPPQVSFCPKDEVFTGNYKWDIMVKRQALMSKCRLLNYSSHPWESFTEFDETFGKKLSTPAGRELWRDDFHFGRQRLCGCNPSLITLCKVIPENFAVTSGMVEPFLEGMSLQDAMDTNRIFIISLEILSRIRPENIPNKIPSPFALFFLNAKKMLMPIAVQLFHLKADDNPVFLPSDPWYTWTLAKMWYNNAEAQHHRACSLIGYTHLLIESVAIATHRNLSPSHPVFRLLAPFIRDIIPINCFEINELLSPGFWIDKCTSLGSQGTLDLLSLGWQEWRLDVQGCLPRDLIVRGVADPNVLPDYPYRDDSLPLYHAIENFVRTVILNKYIHPEILTADSELRQWCIELVSDGDDGCSIKGIPGDGLITTADELITLLTSIIFQTTVGNAAVNTPQYEEYGYIPNYPALLMGSPPKDKSWREENCILDCLPPKNTSIDIMVVTKLLSERRSYGLANLSTQYLYDPDDLKAWERFFDDLKGISHTIQDSNRKRSTVYDYINPVRTFL
ncbi:hypothetical protein QZH41_019984, partial [Actinostola sp. cb2023]